MTCGLTMVGGLPGKAFLPLSSKWPVFKFLRSFDAAVRHGSFKGAAGELNVSASAISQQIKQLEENLGTPLFIRASHGLELSSAGRTLHKAARESVVLMEDAISSVVATPDIEVLRVSSVPSFATLWLVHRLPDFLESYPGIEVHVTSTAQIAPILNDTVDIGIRLGRGDWMGLTSRRLFTDCFVAVCHRKIKEDAASLLNGQSGRCRLIEDTDPNEVGWVDWQSASRTVFRELTLPLRFSSSTDMVQSALAGHGVALIRRSLLDGHPESSALYILPGPQLPASTHWHAVTNPAFLNRPSVRNFLSWLEKQSEMSDATNDA